MDEKERITSMIEAMMELARGNYSIQVELTGNNDDLDALAMGLNMMIDDIRDSQERLKRKVADHEQAEKALRKSEERFRNIAENTQGWIWEVDIEGRYTYASPVVEQILGYMPGEMLTKHFYDLFLAEDREELTKAAFDVFDKKESFRGFVNRNVHKDGRTVWLSTSGVPMFDVNGNLSGYRGADTDITERKQAEVALLASEERYRSLQDNVPVGVFRSTPEGRIISVNPTLVRMLGYDDEKQLLKMSVVDTYVDSDRRKEFRRLLDEEKAVTDFVVQLRKKDGSILWVSLSAREVTDEAGKVLHYDGIMQDVTARTQLEEREDRYVGNLRFLYDSALEFVELVPDRDLYRYIGSKIRKLIKPGLVAVASYDEASDKFTSRFVEGLGLKADTLRNLFNRNPVGMEFSMPYQAQAELLAGEMKKVPTLLDKISDLKMLAGVEKRARKLLGFEDMYMMGLARKERLFGFVLLVMPKGVVLTDKDVVETFINQTSLVLHREWAERRMKQALRERELLLKEVHHRVKNNLQVVSSLLNLQAGYVKDDKVRSVFADSRNRIESLALIHEKLYRSSDLVRVNFCDYINELAQSLVSSCGIDTRSISLEVDVKDIYLGVDKAIPVALIINELVSNSLQHAFPDGQQGKILICFKTGNNSAVTLTVEDNGIGLPEEVDFKKSSSMGLRLVNMLTDQLRGEVELDKTAGTRFNIRFMLGDKS